MGKLKSSLAALATLADSIEKKGGNSLSEIQGCATSVKEVGGRIAGGYELLYMYLKQKAISQKQKVDAWSKDTLKTHMDTKVAGFITDIGTAQKNLEKVFKTYEDTVTVLTKTLLTDIDRAEAFMTEIERQIAKKKKALLQSAKFKAKIVAYENSLNQLGRKLATLKVDSRNYRQGTQSLGPNKIASLKITDGTTIARVFSVADLGLKQELDAMKNQTQSKRLAMLLKDYGTEIKQIRSWAGEADAMEAVSGK